MTEERQFFPETDALKWAENVEAIKVSRELGLEINPDWLAATRTTFIFHPMVVKPCEHEPIEIKV